MITKESLTEHISKLKEAIEKTSQQVLMYQGALADTQFWLEQLEKPVEEPTETPSEN